MPKFDSGDPKQQSRYVQDYNYLKGLTEDQAKQITALRQEVASLKRTGTGATTEIIRVVSGGSGSSSSGGSGGGGTLPDPVTVAHGGTGAMDAATARTNLGLGTASVLNVPGSGDAASGEVVKGTDTRLTDSRTKGVRFCFGGSEIPTSTGAAGPVLRIPYAVGGSTLTFNLTKIFLRRETPGTATTTIKIQKSASGGAFSATDIGSVSVTATNYDNTSTTSLGSVSSGDLIRVNFTALGGTGGGAWEVCVEADV